MKILLTDIYFRKSFDVINILKLHYQKSDFIFTDSSVSLIKSLKSKLIYGSRNIHLLRMDDNFEKDLLKIAKVFDEDIIYIPIEEGTTIKFAEFLSKNKTTKFKYLLTSLDNFSTSRNKEALNIFCEKNEIACPKYISEQTLQRKEFTFPLICKPKHGSGAKGITYIENEEDLKQLKIDFSESFVQERLPNPKDVEAGFFLCEKGEIKSFYSHKRIRTYPEKGGVTVFSQCTYSSEIKKIGSSVIQKLNWSGILMIEFIFDERDKTYKLIEINPRLWGSVLLSEFCGLDFLENYIELSLGKSVLKTEVKSHKFIRWIFPYDILFWLKHLSNPFKFFKIKNNTCYINFTYSSLKRSLLFIFLTYFSLNKIGKLLKNG